MPVPHDPTCTCRQHPLHASMRVRDALDAYLGENGFTREGYTAPRAHGSLFGIPISVPNPPAHQRGIKLHDLLHVATGFGTDHAGEAEISAWQVRVGLGGTGAYVAGIILFNTLVGLAVAPRRTLAMLVARTPARSLFTMDVGYESLLDRTVGELRELLGLPPEGLARRARALHVQAPPAADSR